MGLAKPKASLAELLYGCNAQEIALGAAGQEKFCRLVAAGHTLENAYAMAYELDRDKRSNCAGEAMRLSRAPHIVARIMQIRAAGIRGYTVQREDLLEPLLWALNTARQNNNTETVRKIVMDIGKLFGLVIDKIQADISGQFTVMKEVTVDGNALVFDIGSGQQVHIKGDSIDSSSTGYEDTDGELDILEGSSPQAVLQNSFKELPMQSLEQYANQHVVGRKRKPQAVVVKPKPTPTSPKMRKVRDTTKAPRSKVARVRPADDGLQVAGYIGEDIV